MTRKLILCFLIVMPLTAFGYILLQRLPGLNAGTEGPNLTDYLSWLFRFMLVAAAFLAVVQIVIGGIQMIIGGASETQRSSAKTRIQDALWGLLLALASWLILYTINPNLASMQLTIPEVVIQATTSVPGDDAWRRTIYALPSSCTPACRSGEVCRIDPVAGTRTCVMGSTDSTGCNPADPRSCPSGQQCVFNSTTQRASCQ